MVELGAFLKPKSPKMLEILDSIFYHLQSRGSELCGVSCGAETGQVSQDAALMFQHAPMFLTAFSKTAVALLTGPEDGMLWHASMVVLCTVGDLEYKTGI